MEFEFEKKKKKRLKLAHTRFIFFQKKSIHQLRFLGFLAKIKGETERRGTRLHKKGILCASNPKK